MSASATPKQGDHVFNDIGIAVMRLFEEIRSLRSDLVDGQHFLHDHLLHSYSMAKKMIDAPVLLMARKLVASDSAEENALREINKLRPRYPALVRVDPSFLRHVHLRNADEFGNAGKRFEAEVFRAIQQSLEWALAPAIAKPVVTRTPSPSIACQQMLSAAYDPAAALIVITASMSLEALPIQAAFHSVIVEIAGTLDRPAMWKDPYGKFREDRPSTTGKIICEIQKVLTRIDLLKAQSLTFATLIKGEIGHKARSPDTDPLYGGMLHLLHTRLQQMNGTSA